MKSYIKKIVAGVISVSTIIITGCSPTGWATKDLPDGSNITPGKSITILQKDGNQIIGTFIGEQKTSPSEYFSEYNQSIDKNSLDLQLPKIGETVELTTTLTDSRAWIGQLVGFDKQSLWLQFPYQAEPTEIYISSLTTISHGNEKSLGRTQFRKLYLEGTIPLTSALVVENGEGTVRVPLNTVTKVFENSSNTTANVLPTSQGSN